MKLHDFLTEEQLDELDFKKAIGAGVLGAAALGSFNPSVLDKPKFPDRPKTVAPIKKDEAKELSDRILQKYKINPELALRIAKLAKKNEKADFPRAEDLLSIVGIESSFNPGAVSALKKDPAIGLTQIRPGVHNLDAKRLIKDIDQQIEKSAEILHKYNKHLKNKEAAIIAYNVGPGAYRKGEFNQNYINKFNRERQLYR